ncbi:MAG: hypothetical protein K0U78_14385 [Actinomycetia bacterium]|nr:hypothetical protein [Actinomycetes bacterium]
MTALTLADLTELERDRLAVAVHEAGHAVAATLLGGRISMACVGTFGGYALGETRHSHVPAGAEPSILFAGPWAEARWLTGRRPTPRDMYRVLDGHGCRDYTALQASGGTAAASSVAVLLERCWPSVIELAKRLWHPGIARHTEVCAALGLSSDPDTRAVELALIRSGSAPGTFAVSTPKQ